MDFDPPQSNEEFIKTIPVEQELISSQFSSLITDKYREDMDAPTVANKIANMVIDLESKSKPDLLEKCDNPDPEEIYYSDDEVFQSEDEEGDGSGDESRDLELDLDYGNLSYEDLSHWKKLKCIKTKINKITLDSENMWSKYCRCSLGRQIGFALEYTFELDNMDLNEPELETIRSAILLEVRNCIKKAREYIMQKDIC